MKAKSKKPAVRREQFADGSALITYPDGSVLILESDLAKPAVVRDARPVNYSVSPLPPASGKPRAKLKQTSGENWDHLKKTESG